MIEHICGNGVSFDWDGGRHNHIAQNGAAADPFKMGFRTPSLRPIYKAYILRKIDKINKIYVVCHWFHIK
jgi:hypothetical protein